MWRMQPQVDPRFTLAGEIFLLTLGMKEFWSRAFDRKVHIPASVEDLVHEPHAAAFVDCLDLVKAENHVADIPFCWHLALRELTISRRVHFLSNRGSGGWKSAGRFVNWPPRAVAESRMSVRKHQRHLAYRV